MRSLALRSWRKFASVGWQIILPVALVVAWWLWSAGSSSLYFPPLSEILSKFVDTWFGLGFTQHVVPSLRNLAFGFVIGSLLGVGMGIPIGRSRLLRWLLSPLYEYARALPPPAILPFAILILGIGPAMHIGVIVFGVVFAVLLNTIDGVKGVERTLDEVGEVYNIPSRRRLIHIIIPAASPQIMVGLRNGLSIAVLMMMVSEMVAARHGIGFFTLRAQANFTYLSMWSGIILLAIIGVVVNLLFTRLVEGPAMWWHRESTEQAE